MDAWDVRKIFNEAGDLRNDGQTRESVGKYKEAMELYQKAGDEQMVAECWQMIGVNYFIEDKPQKAVEVLRKAADIYINLNDSLGLGNTYRDIGVAYTVAQEYKESIKWFNKSEQALQETNDYSALGITQIKRGLAYQHLNQLDEAEEAMSTGLSNTQKGDNWFMEMTGFMNLAELRIARERYSQAVALLWAALGRIFTAEDQQAQNRRLTEIYALLSSSYNKLGNQKWSVEFKEKAEELLEEMPADVAAIVRKKFLR